MSTHDNDENDAAAVARRLATERPDRVTWKPTQGDSIAGEVHYVGPEFSPVASNNRQDVLDIDCQHPDEQKVRIWQGAVVEEEVERLGVEKGDIVAVAYRGDRESQKGFPYHSYAVEIVRRASKSPPTA